jgi:hypothetical protein
MSKTLLNLVRHKSIRANTLLDVVREKTIQQISTDKAAGFTWSTVKKKEDLGILNNNLVLEGEEFPQDAKPGQLFVKNGKLYKYKGE